MRQPSSEWNQDSQSRGTTEVMPFHLSRYLRGLQSVQQVLRIALLTIIDAEIPLARAI